jgi:tetratricopeptide (TPR) repeat protein/tRNA A-37 threonylcarbamoyl transferase component Bud32
MTGKWPSGASLRGVERTVYNRAAMARDGQPYEATDLDTLPGSLALAAGPPQADAALKASLKAALFHKLQEPTRIGRFALIERLGAGAMGEVYAAYDEQLDRKVAIKLVRPDRRARAEQAGPDSMNSQRLLREAKVLARLSHPNVVQVYEAGLFGERVFVAMEFIRGQTLRQWLGTPGRAPAPERWRRALEMLVAAGRGLQAAHAAGLVHRDFKPDNVLVGHDGRVCVADFGLARAAENDPAGATLDSGDELAGALSDAGTIPQHEASASDAPSPLHSLTATGTILGTPGYMSPEQMRGEPSDSRSDQFSFCVTLYEALYRERPFVAPSLAELRQSVIDGAYAPPPADTEVPARILNVLARGLAADPAARYASMGELLAALERDPAQHRRRYLAAGLLLAAGAVAGGVMLRAGAAVAEDPCALAGSAVARRWSPEVAGRVHEAFLATNVAYAGAASELVRARMDDYAAALAAERRATCEATHVRREQPEDLLRLATLCLDGRERHMDALIAELTGAGAGTVEHSARMVAELPRVEVCRDGESLMLGLQPPDDAAIAAQVQQIRARLATVRVQHGAGRYAEAQRRAEEALAATDAIDYPPVRAEALHLLGITLRDGATAADVARAEQTLQQALDLAEGHRHDELVNEIWLDLVFLAANHHQDLATAHQWARRALATSQRRPAGGQQRARALGFAGALHFRAGDHAQAERLQQEALAVAEQSGASPLVLAERWHHLANTRAAMARFDEARAAFGRALPLLRAELGDRHPHVARMKHDFGIFLRGVGELDDARVLLADALATWTSVHGPESMDTVHTQLALNLLEIEAGNYDQAETHARGARDILAAVAPASPVRARAEVRLGLSAFRQRRFEDALAAFERGLAIQRQTGAQPSTIALNLCNIAETLAELGRFERALSTLVEAERILAGAMGVPTVIRAVLHKARGLALAGQGNQRRAIQELERALRLLESEPGNLLEKADVQWALARALGGKEQARARGLAEAARAIHRTRGRAGAASSEEIARWLERQPRR